jgi:hypothetical protein
LDHFERKRSSDRQNDIDIVSTQEMRLMVFGRSVAMRDEITTVHAMICGVYNVVNTHIQHFEINIHQPACLLKLCSTWVITVHVLAESDDIADSLSGMRLMHNVRFECHEKCEGACSNAMLNRAKPLELSQQHIETCIYVSICMKRCITISNPLDNKKCRRKGRFAVRC